MMWRGLQPSIAELDAISSFDRVFAASGLVTLIAVNTLCAFAIPLVLFGLAGLAVAVPASVLGGEVAVLYVRRMQGERRHWRTKAKRVLPEQEPECGNLFERAFWRVGRYLTK
jgi:hypothetical protein